MKITKILNVLILIGTLIFVSGLWLLIEIVEGNTAEISRLKQRVYNLETVIDSQEVMAPREFQKYLNKREPKTDLIIKEDGRIGPKTIAKWERIYCNQSAAKTFFEKGENHEKHTNFSTNSAKGYYPERRQPASD